MIPDILTAIVATLADAHECTVRVNRLEPGDTVPLIVVRAPFTGAGSSPAPTWWRGLVQCDVLDVDDLTAWQFATAVNDTLAGMTGGTYETCVVSTVAPAGIVPVSPSGLVPGAGHWAVSVTVTARRPGPQEVTP